MIYSSSGHGGVLYINVQLNPFYVSPLLLCAGVMKYTFLQEKEFQMLEYNNTVIIIIIIIIMQYLGFVQRSPSEFVTF